MTTQTIGFRHLPHSYVHRRKEDMGGPLLPGKAWTNYTHDERSLRRSLTVQGAAESVGSVPRSTQIFQLYTDLLSIRRDGNQRDKTALVRGMKMD